LATGTEPERQIKHKFAYILRRKKQKLMLKNTSYAKKNEYASLQN